MYFEAIGLSREINEKVMCENNGFRRILGEYGKKLITFNGKPHTTIALDISLITYKNAFIESQLLSLR